MNSKRVQAMIVELNRNKVSAKNRTKKYEEYNNLEKLER